MPVDPQIAGLLEFLAAAGAPPMHEGTPEQARAAFRALAVGARPAEKVVPVAEVSELDAARARRASWRRGSTGPTPPGRCRPWCCSTAAAG